jgi:hypothetical protein
MPNVKEHWKKGPRPDCACGRKLVPTATEDSGELFMEWTCRCGFRTPMQCDWPFVEDEVMPSAFRPLGFVVEYA